VKRVTFHPEADAEMMAAAEFYEAKSAGLGSDFIAEVGGTRALVAYSRIGHRFSKRLHRVLVQRHTVCCTESKASASSWLPLRISGGAQGTGITANLPPKRMEPTGMNCGDGAATEDRSFGVSHVI
jgi:hypothetical protein